MTDTRRVYLSRHYNVRKHETWSADVPAAMLEDPTMFLNDGPTARFDQWMCDNGQVSGEQYDVLDDDQLEYESEVVEDLAEQGRRLASEHMVGRGLTELDRNWHGQGGSIDLVMRDRDETVFVAVKTRTTTAFGHPLEAITASSLAKLRRMAGQWMEDHNGTGRIRIDAIAVIAPTLPSVPTIEHLERVF